MCVCVCLCVCRGMGHPGARVFRAQYGGMPPRRPAQQSQQSESRSGGGQDDVSRLLFNLFQFLPVILLVLISMFAGGGSCMHTQHTYTHEHVVSMHGLMCACDDTHACVYTHVCACARARVCVCVLQRLKSPQCRL